MNNLASCCRGCKSFPVNCTFMKNAVTTVDIIATEAYATLRYILPASLTWIWRKYITNEIKTIPVQVTLEKVSKIAYLNIHGNCQIEKDKEFCPILLSHGDYGHPYNMLHLADIAQNKGHPVFSLYIPGIKNSNQFEIHNCLLKQAIDKIENIVKDHYGKFTGIFGVGHSRGAILLAQRQFVSLDSRIKATCSIAGRLNAPDEKDCPDQILKTIVKKIYEGILKNSDRPIMQIIPKDDWNASYESMAVRPHKYCYTVPGKHLSGLYSNETRTHFADFLEEFYPNISR